MARKAKQIQPEQLAAILASFDRGIPATLLAQKYKVTLKMMHNIRISRELGVTTALTCKQAPQRDTVYDWAMNPLNQRSYYVDFRGHYAN